MPCHHTQCHLCRHCLCHHYCHYHHHPQVLAFSLPFWIQKPGQQHEARTLDLGREDECTTGGLLTLLCTAHTSQSLVLGALTLLAPLPGTPFHPASAPYKLALHPLLLCPTSLCQIPSSSV